MKRPSGNWQKVAGVASAAVLSASATVWITMSSAWAGPAGIFEANPVTATDGQKIFEQICQGCHMPNAQGAEGAGHYPALAGDPALSSRQYMALTLLQGRRNMPAFGTRHAVAFVGAPMALSNEQIAAVINYVRSHFGNHYRDRISAAEVDQLDRGGR